MFAFESKLSAVPQIICPIKLLIRKCLVVLCSHFICSFFFFFVFDQEEIIKEHEQRNTECTQHTIVFCLIYDPMLFLKKKT